VIRTTGNGAPACKICGSPYKTLLKLHSGKRISILQPSHEGPFISFIVVTKHDSNPVLFNTKFQLNFGGLTDDLEGFVNSLVVGRSSSSDMVLDYRTVSTQHARVICQDDEFFLQDLGSSNGTMVYLKKPVAIPWGRSVRFRMGRSTITMSVCYDSSILF